MTRGAIMGMQCHRPAQRRSIEQAGFTLIELMIGMVVGLIVVAAGFTILTTSSKALRANEQTIDMQQNVRMAMEVLTRGIRRAGFGAPGVPIGNCTNSIVPNDQNATGIDTGPDSMQVLVPAARTTGSNRWTLKTPTTPAGANQIVLQPGAVTDMVSSGLVVNTSYISIGGAATAKVTGGGTFARTIHASIPPPP